LPSAIFEAQPQTHVCELSVAFCILLFSARQLHSCAQRQSLQHLFAEATVTALSCWLFCSVADSAAGIKKTDKAAIIIFDFIEFPYV
jgi:hypothetical protein